MKLNWDNKEYAPSSFQADASGGDIASERHEYCIDLSERIADGHVITETISQGLFLTHSEMNFKKDTVFRETYRERSVLQLSFCIEGDCEWNYCSRENYRVAPSECSLQSGILNRCESCYHAGITYRAIGISLENGRYGYFLDYLQKAHRINTIGDINTRVFTSTPRIRRILQQLSDVPTDSCLRNMYLEGKMLELLSVFCSEALERCIDVNIITRDDYGCVLQARDMIDRRFLYPLTLSQIAEASYLSETKLKQCFKICFGCTVYDYIIEKRMELAYRLLNDGKHKIKDIVWMVGYSSQSHFAETFRKRYGINPSDVI